MKHSPGHAETNRSPSLIPLRARVTSKNESELNAPMKRLGNERIIKNTRKTVIWLSGRLRRALACSRQGAQYSRAIDFRFGPITPPPPFTPPPTSAQKARSVPYRVVLPPAPTALRPPLSPAGPSRPCRLRA